MRRLWIASGILLALCAATAVNVLGITGVTQQVAAVLIQAQESVEDGDWDQAEELTLRAEQSFQDWDLYLHITLRHSDIDAVEVAFQEVKQLLHHRERPGEYAAANARLVARVELLAESEAFTLINIL